MYNCNPVSCIFFSNINITDTFWKVWGFIYGFKNLHIIIYLGLEENDDESTSVIFFEPHLNVTWPTTHLYSIIWRLFYSCFFKPMLFQYLCLFLLKMRPYIIYFLALNEIMISISYIYVVLNIFMNIPGFEKGHNTTQNN